MKNIKLIKASAGSGKTWNLMEGAANSVQQKGVAPSEFMITTFTKRAAAELSQRVRQKFLHAKDPETAAKMSESIIGTVNSICASFLQDYALFAGLSPAIEVLPQSAKEVLLRIASTDAEDEIPQDILKTFRRLDIDSVKKSSDKKPWNSDYDWQKDVQHIIEYALCNNIGPAEILESGKRSVEELRKTFSGNQQNFLDEVDKFLKTVDLVPKHGNTKRWMKLVKEFRNDPTWKRAYSILNGGPTQDLKQLSSEQRDRYDFLKGQFFESADLFNDLCAVISFQFKKAALYLGRYQSYKREYGLTDFSDQEVNILQLAKTSEEFRALIAERVRQFMVDEFQDTSPIQLALFIALHRAVQKAETAEQTVWVGDPKQSIYGFRGADMRLISEVEKEIENTPGSETAALDCSWRSKRDLVLFSNTVFTHLFPGRRKEDVTLKIPEERESDPDPGKLSCWITYGNNKEKRAIVLANRIAKMICDGTPAGDIAVLCRSSYDCDAVASALNALNVPVSMSSKNLANTPEYQLLMAAYRYAVSPSNQMAGFLYTAMTGEGANCLESLIKMKSEKEWEGGSNSDELFKNTVVCEQLRNLQTAADETPRELIERLITVLKLDERLAGDKQYTVRMQNLEAIMTAADEYFTTASLCLKPASLSGFPAWLDQNPPEVKTYGGKNMVNVLTYHSAKGLEWPVVILYSLNYNTKTSLFGTACYTDGSIDPANPLQNRVIHSWTNPLGDDLLEYAANKPLAQEYRKRAVEEECRLLYVGVTRAKTHLVFALECESKEKFLQDRWLRDIAFGEDFFNWPAESGLVNWTIAGKTFPLNVEELSESDKPYSIDSPDRSFTDEAYRIPAAEFYPAFLSPSGAAPTSGMANLVASRPDQVQLSGIGSGDELYARFGNAFHAYLALEPQTGQRELAEQILRNWNLETANAQQICDAADWFTGWVEKTYPGAEVMTEVPVTLRAEHGETYQGYIDYLIETDAGYIIVDHKTYGNPSDAAEFAVKQLAQLQIYRDGVERGTGKKVLGMYIHLPVLGRIYEIS